MASRNSFLDSPSFRRITTPTQREAVSRRRRSSGFRGGGGSSDPIRRETEAERTQRLRQERLESFQSELSDTGTRLTASERQAILEGTDVEEIREQVATRQRKQGFASLQRDLSRSGTELTPEEAELIASGQGSPSDVRQRISQRRGRTFSRPSRSTSFVETSRGDIAVSEGFASRTQELQESGAFERAIEQERARELEEFASQSDELTVVSGRDGPMLVTTSGESVGGVSLGERASFISDDPRVRVVTSSGRDVTPRQEITVGGVVSPSSRTPFSQTRAGRLIGTQSEADAVRDFAGGFTQALVRPGDSAREVFQVGEQGRIDALSSTRASTLGQFVGVASGAGALGLGIRGAAFTLGAARQAGVRGLSRLGLTTVASRQAAGAVAAPIVGAGLLAPEVSQRTFRVATNRSTFGEEAFSFGVNRAVEFGAGAIVGRGARRAFRAGEAANIANAGFTRSTVLRGGRKIDDLVSTSIADQNNQIRNIFVRTKPTSSQQGFTPQGSFVTGSGQTQLTFGDPATIRRRQVRSAFASSNPPIIVEEFGLAGGRGITTVPVTPEDFGSRASPIVGSPNDLQRELAFLDAFDTNPSVSRESGVFRRRSFERSIEDFTEPLSTVFVRRTTQPPSTISISQILPEQEVFRFSDGDFFPRRIGGDIGRGVPRFSQSGFSGPSAQNILDTSDSVNIINRIRDALPNRRGQQSLGLFQINRNVGRFSSTPPRSTRVGARPSRAARRASRSIDDLGFGFVPRIGVSSGLRGGLASIQGLSGAQRTPFSLGQEDLFGLRNNQGLRGSQRVGVGTAFDTQTIQDTQLISIPRITTRTPPPRRRVPGGRTPPPPRRPRIPDIDLPPLNFGQSRRGRGRSTSGRREEFTPSVIANFLNIRGDRPSISTGIEIRPILQ